MSFKLLKFLICSASSQAKVKSSAGCNLKLLESKRLLRRFLIKNPQAVMIKI